jgi:hypothetical protein
LLIAQESRHCYPALPQRLSLVHRNELVVKATLRRRSTRALSLSDPRSEITLGPGTLSTSISLRDSLPRYTSSLLVAPSNTGGHLDGYLSKLDHLYGPSPPPLIQTLHQSTDCHQSDQPELEEERLRRALYPLSPASHLTQSLQPSSSITNSYPSTSHRVRRRRFPLYLTLESTFVQRLCFKASQAHHVFGINPPTYLPRPRRHHPGRPDLV